MLRILRIVAIALAVAMTSSRVTAAMDDDTVKQWIAASLGDGSPGDSVDAIISKNYPPTQTRESWERLKRCRDGGDTQDLELAAAEHFMFARSIASEKGDTNFRLLPAWYETFKKFALKAEFDKHIQS